VNYCSHCGGEISRLVPPGDNLPRHVCITCGYIHYQNPLMVVGSLPIKEEQVLLCRRAINPRSGFWTLPAGFLENGESAWEGAIRETWEEARAKVGEGTLYRLYDLTHIRQVYLFYRALLLNDDFGAGEESTEVALFREEDIPWNKLAFPVITYALQDFFRDRKEDNGYTMRHKKIEPMTRFVRKDGG